MKHARLLFALIALCCLALSSCGKKQVDDPLSEGEADAGIVSEREVGEGEVAEGEAVVDAAAAENAEGGGADADAAESAAQSKDAGAGEGDAQVSGNQPAASDEAPAGETVIPADQVTEEIDLSKLDGAGGKAAIAAQGAEPHKELDAPAMEIEAAAAEELRESEAAADKRLAEAAQSGSSEPSWWSYAWPWLFILAGLVLVLIDYLFPTDWPAYLGYVLFSWGIFGLSGMGTFGLRFCLGLATLVGLLVLHHIYLSRFLTNADDDDQPELAR